MLVDEPAVEPSEAGARVLGVTYWQAVDRLTRGGVRASWNGCGGRLRLLGGATLLTFGPPELAYDNGAVSCRHEIRGGLLALRAGGSVTLTQRQEGRAVRAQRRRRGVSAPACRPGRRASVDRDAVCQGAEPVSRRRQPALLRAARPGTGHVRMTVFGATGVVGRALLPLLGEHEVTAVSREPRDAAGARWLVADASSGVGVPEALDGADVAYYLVHSLGSRDFEEQDRAAAETVAHQAARAGVKQIIYLGGLGADDPDSSPHRAAAARPASASPRQACR